MEAALSFLTQLEQQHTSAHHCKADKFVPAEGYFLASHQTEGIDQRGNKKLRHEYY